MDPEDNEPKCSRENLGMLLLWDYVAKTISSATEIIINWDTEEQGNALSGK